MKKILVVLVAAALSWASVAIAQDQPVRSIVNVTGDLYRFQENNHYGVFLVTDEGIILADPISHDNAQWLKGQLAEQFGVPVKYVIYSHDHADHTSGGEVFADTATFVAHFAAKPKIEESGHTPVPDKRFPWSYKVELGNGLVELYYFTKSHSDNLITLYFPEEKAVFLVDLVAVKRLPYRNLRDYYFPSAIDYLSYVEEIEFDILIPGHGPMGVKQDVVDHRIYLETLMAEVEKAKDKGKTVEEAKKIILFEDYKDWGQYEAWRELNIEGMYRILEENEKLKNWPERISRVEVKYPRNAYQMNVEGWAVLGFDINSDGKTENIRILDSAAETTTRGITETDWAKKLFEKKAIKALAKYVYEQGKPVENQRFIIDFVLPYSRTQGGSFFSLPSYGGVFRDITMGELMARDQGGSPAVCC